MSKHKSSQIVIGIREGSGLLVEDKKMTLYGDHSARIFEQGKEAYEVEGDLSKYL